MSRQPTNSLLRIAYSLIFIGAMLLAFNLFNTWRTVQEYSTFNFWDVFWYTEGSNGRNTARITVQVWGPVIFIPLGALLLIISAVRGKGRGQGAQRGADVPGVAGQAAAGQFGGAQYGGAQNGKAHYGSVQSWDAQFAHPGQAQPGQAQPGAQAGQRTPHAPQYGRPAPQQGGQPAPHGQSGPPSGGQRAQQQYEQQTPEVGDGSAAK